LNREWPIARGLTAASFSGFLVHEGTQQELGAGTDNRIRKGTPE
jgi:hypothetical protein